MPGSARQVIPSRAARAARSGPSASTATSPSPSRDLADVREPHAEPSSERGARRVHDAVGRQRREQLVVLAARQRERAARRPARRPSRSAARPARRRARTRAPTPLAAHSRDRSIASPSETSIIAVAPAPASDLRPRRRAATGRSSAVDQRAAPVGAERARRHAGRRARARARRPRRRATPSRRPVARAARPARVTARPGATSPDHASPRSTSEVRATGSPPTSASAYSSQASRIPPTSSITQAASTSAGSREATSANRGLAAHRRDVAHVHRDGLVAEVARRDRAAVEVHALDQQVGGQHQVARAGLDHRRVVARAPRRRSGPAPDSTRRIASISSSSVRSMTVPLASAGRRPAADGRAR